jgi:hypothetical protein
MPPSLARGFPLASAAAAPSLGVRPWSLSSRTGRGPLTREGIQRCPRRAPEEPSPAVASRRKPRAVGEISSPSRHQPSTAANRWTIS